MIDPQVAFRDMAVTLNTDGRLEVRWRLPSTLPYFAGHFPGNPVFPAVGIVDASVYAIKQKSLSHGALNEVMMAKFMQPIRPGQDVSIEIRPAGAGEWRAAWTDGASRAPLAELRLRMES